MCLLKLEKYHIKSDLIFTLYNNYYKCFDGVFNILIILKPLK